MLKRPGIAFTIMNPSLNSLIKDVFSAALVSLALKGIFIKNNGTTAIKNVTQSIKKMYVIGNKPNSKADKIGPTMKIKPENKKFVPFTLLILSLGTIEGRIAWKVGT